MGKATIIEAQNSVTEYEMTKSSGILGKLKGIFADYKNGTRNADRLYSEELWDNRVFGSEEVMEALETKTLFGELDHPEGDRCETLAKNAAISITKLEKRPEEGVIYGEAEILDTPTGRIVKALADSGARLGISSRGMGEEIYCEGQNIIDPETYDFITFDVVVTPANAKARVSLQEGVKINVLKESFKKEIHESETDNQLNQIKKVIENVNLAKPGQTELLNLIETKKEKLNNKNIKKENKLIEANKEIALQYMKESLKENNEQLSETNKANISLVEENEKLIKENTFYKESRESIKSKLKNSIIENSQFKKELEDINKKLNEANKQIDIKEDESKENLLRLRQMNEKKIENLEIKYKEKIEELTESNKQLNNKVDKLTEANQNLSKNLESHSKIILENNELKNKVESLMKEKTNKLQESKILENNKIKALESRIKELESKNKVLENQCKNAEDLEDRFNKLSFNPIGNVKALRENINTDMSQEEIDLFNVLTNN